VREDLPREIAKGMTFHFVRNITEVLEIALGLKLKTTTKVLEPRSVGPVGEVGTPKGSWN
jgi:hypothetical protein